MTSAPDAGPVRLCSRGDLRQIAARLAGMRVTLMGLGLFGGGVGAARFLIEQGARLTVTDLRPADRLAPSLECLEGLPCTYRLGRHAQQDFAGAELIVANPAVPRTSPYLRAAQRAGVPIASPMNLFLALCPAPVAAVTGSNGKSTTTALLAAMLRSAGRRLWMGGNIGISLLPALESIEPTDLVVLELSSFQLMDAEHLPWSPRVAVVTNLTPNHLDRHGTFAAYAEAKRGILKVQGAEDFAVLNARDAVLARWAEEGTPARTVLFDAAPDATPVSPGVSLVGERLIWRDESRSELLCLRQDVPLLGMHNTENAMAAAAAACCLGARGEAVRAALASFIGLEHRLELVGEYDGVRFYNDSYSTTPASGVAAVRSFGGPVTLIGGGYDKGLDLAPLAREAARSVEVLVTVGQTGPALAWLARQEAVGMGRPLVVREARALDEAVLLADALSVPGSAVVFSPGCASYDMFENFDHRGKAFKDLVRTRLGRRDLRSRRA